LRGDAHGDGWGRGLVSSPSRQLILFDILGCFDFVSFLEFESF
jgi:hypothetical protein